MTMATLSVIDLAVIPIIGVLRCHGGRDDGVTGDYPRCVDLSKGQPARNYGGNNEDEGFANMVDLGDLIRNTGAGITGDLRRSTKALSAVQYNVKGKSRAKANGLSVYFPLAVNYESWMLMPIKRLPV